MQTLAKPLYQVRLLGGLEIQCGGKVITRFRSRQTAGLFAFLSFHRNKRHLRETLVEQFWPDTPDLEHGRASLSVAISSLRSQLEPPGSPHGSVILADARNLGLNPETVHTDVDAFEDYLDKAKKMTSFKESLPLLESAVKLYRGPLLTGYYDNWILDNLERLRGRYSAAMAQIASLYEGNGELDSAIDWYRQAIQSDEADTASLTQLLDLLLKSGREREAVRTYHSVENRLAAIGDAIPRQVQHMVEGALSRHPVEPVRKHSVRRGRPRKTPMPSLFDTPVSLEAHTQSDITNREESPTTLHILSDSKPPGVSPLEERHWVSPLPLPTPLTRFFGREREIAQIEELLHSSDTRLLTLTGPGGIGKTRIATLVSKQREVQGEAVFFVQLVSQRSDAMFYQALAEAVGAAMPNRANADMLEPTIRVLSIRPSLLVLDNFEQLVDTAAPEIVIRLLTQVPDLTCMVTSQHRLPVPGEISLTIPPLPAPDDATRARLSRGELTTAALESDWPSIALFLDRARETLPDFQINAKNALTIANLTARLEGVPLAIELAASRVQILSPKQILDSLSRTFDVLVSRRQSSMSRHRSLQASMEWSYRLLSEPVRQCFKRLSVFRGSFTADAVAHVVNDETALDYLAQLCDTSLLRPQMSDRAIRFQMLDMLRIFGGEQLQPEERDETERLHARYFRKIAEEARSHWNQPDESERLDELSLDMENFRAAMAWALSNNDTEATEIAYQITSALVRVWRIRGLHKEGAAYLTRLLVRPVTEEEAPLALQATALNAAGILTMTMGEHEQASEWYRRCLVLLRQLRNKKSIAGLLNNIGSLEAERGNWSEAIKFCEESLTLYREMGDTGRIGAVLSNLGVVALRSGDITRARRLCEESLKLARRQNNRFDMGLIMHNLAEVYYDEGDLPMAETMYRESLHLLTPFGERDFNSNSVLALGIIACRRGERGKNPLLRAGLTYRYSAELPLNLFVEKQLECISLRPSEYIDHITEHAAEQYLIETIEDLITAE